jgi:hypothetical protein
MQSMAAQQSMSPSGIDRANGGLLSDIRRSVHLRDLCVLSIAPIVMLLLFQLPTSVKRAFAFHYLDPSLESAYISNYIHLSSQHLLANLMGFTLLASIVYLLFALSSRRAFFFTALTAILLGFPIVLSVLNLAVPRNAIGFGFSGLNAALLGLLPVALHSYSRAHVSREFETQTTVSAFLLSLTAIAFMVLPFSVSSGPVIGLAFAGSVVTHSFSWRRIVRDIVAGHRYGDLLLVSGVLWMGFLLFGFGIRPTFDGASVNQYIHLLGYCLSFMAAVIVQSRLATVDSAFFQENDDYWSWNRNSDSVS